MNTSCKTIDRKLSGLLLGLVMSLGLLVPAVPAANFYVRAGANDPSPDGSNWTKAWADVANINWPGVHPGDTIWLAGGLYGSLHIQTSGATNNRVFIKRVRTTNAAPVAAAGWTNSYDSQAVLYQIFTSEEGFGNFVTVDGQVPYSGILITNGTTAEVHLVDITGQAGNIHQPHCNYFELLNCDLGGMIGTNVSVDPGADPRCFSANSGQGVIPGRGLHVARCHLHGANTLVFTANQEDQLWEYNRFDHNTPQNATDSHPNIWCSLGGDNNVVIRWNDFSDWSVEGIMMTPIADSAPNANWYIYGNLWHDPTKKADGSSNVPRVLESQYLTNGPVYFYNNTCVNIKGFCVIRNDNFGGSPQAGHWINCVQSNNIFMRCDNSISFAVGSQGINCTQDYDLADFNPITGSHSISYAGTDIFQNYAAQDYHLITIVRPGNPKDKGAPLGASYAVDMEGHQRGLDGFWDMGALEAQDAPLVSLTSPPDGSTFQGAMAYVAVSANASKMGGTVTQVEIFAGNLKSTATNAPFKANFSLPPGTYSITARATDQLGNVTTSAPRIIKVIPPPGGPT